jgi:hypothetical protein
MSDLRYTDFISISFSSAKGNPIFVIFGTAPPIVPEISPLPIQHVNSIKHCRWEEDNFYHEQKSNYLYYLL